MKTKYREGKVMEMRGHTMAEEENRPLWKLPTANASSQRCRCCRDWRGALGCGNRVTEIHGSIPQQGNLLSLPLGQGAIPGPQCPAPLLVLGTPCTPSSWPYSPETPKIRSQFHNVDAKACSVTKSLFPFSLLPNTPVNMLCNLSKGGTWVLDDNYS